MKTKITFKILILATLMAFSNAATPLCPAAEAKAYPICNIMSLTDDGATANFIGREEYYYLSYRVRHEPAPETNASWGAAADGLKLSIGFHHQEFLVGEPVIPIIMLRNLNSRPRPITITDYSYKIKLSSGTNTVLYGKEKSAGWWSREDPCEFFGSINGESEIMIVANLSRLFDLNHLGTNSVQVQIQEAAANGKGITNIISGKVAFQIVGKLSASDLAARKAHDDQIAKFQQHLKDHATNSPAK